MNKQFNPEMLILARVLRGLTQTQLAKVANIDQGAISRYEGNLKNITDEHVNKIAQELHFPVSFFYRPGQRKGVESGELFHRARKSISANDLDVIHAQIDLFRLNLEKLLEVADVESPFNVPQYDPTDFDGDIDQIAAAVRSLWKIPSGPISNLTKVLEGAFCIIHMIDFGNDLMDATAQWVEPLPPIIFVNSRASGDRLRFSLAHELAHLVMHHNKEPRSSMEKEADQFASAFLMPAQDISRELMPVTIEHLIHLKPAWKVSIQALIRRSYDIGMISERKYTSLFQMMSRAGYRKEEPFTISREEPSLFRTILKLYQVELQFSVEEIANLLSMNKQEITLRYLSEPFDFQTAS